MKRLVTTLFVLSFLTVGCNQQQQLSTEKQAWCEANPKKLSSLETYEGLLRLEKDDWNAFASICGDAYDRNH